ncbi:type III secretion bridge between inner and outermembrane lipoprotein, YscJ,HrcJ,EscJ, PscJ [Bradyrhizobium oligotrophicum S58]|uniref:Lipoprotein n=1 Tax=Bradyrhizobium oligotrophicum S58 TaxID=1245469 RepID=M4ZHC9_9BRAD|nr:type III secretion inner membrane ring lipoprotein SctJ [Bradyrhizobium oligotrophicum]BAM93189.1 type III secretion bridge between inner and outermembrane lipoprotein, YscJ,HrcJ,EscJ, PscJ [Bradyrhizobium oligotrophicum S58]
MDRVEAKHWRAARGRRLNVVLVLGLAFALSGCKGELYSRLSEKEANLMIALLLHNGIAADRLQAKDGSNTVRVEQERFADSVTLLNASGLPRAKFEDMGSVFSSNGLVSSPTEERAKLIHALNQELARTIMEIDGVISARVHVVLPKNDPLRRDQVPSAASVFIKHDARAEVTMLLPQIKTLIANSVEGLTYDKVAVVFVRGSSEPVELSPSTSIETTASVLSHDGSALRGSPLILGASAAAGVGLLGSIGVFQLWRRARAGRAQRKVPLRRDGGTRVRDPLRVVS